MASSDTSGQGWRREITDLVRAACGGMLVGVPLIYTMEVWSIGSVSTPGRLFAVLAVTFVGVFILNRTSGFRSTKDTNATDALLDTVDALALAVVCIVVLLFMFHDLTAATPLRQGLGKIV
jgi:putative integral membrane protein (TIGR02587 family)